MNNDGNPKSQEQCCEAFGSPEQWRHVFSTCHRHWQRVGSHAVARKSKQRGDLQWLPSFFLFSPVVTNTVTYKRRNSTSSWFVFCFRSAFVLFTVCCSFLFLSVEDLPWSVEWLPGDSHSRIPVGSGRLLTPLSSMVDG